MARKKAGDNQVRVGNVTRVSGKVTIAGGDVYEGYTVEQVTEIIQQIKTQFQPKSFDGRCPYKGLEVFKEEDAEFFFGRDALVEDLVRRIQASRTIFVTGPSGSGKSSLIRAGLLPALKNGTITALHSERWLYETLNPGREPIAELARVAASLAGTLNAGDDIRTKGLIDSRVLAQWCEVALKDDRDKRVVLFIDQFEEIFTQIDKEPERLAFLHLLTHAANVDRGRVIVLFAMRSDFLPNCAGYPDLNALIGQQFIQIGAMRRRELVSAIAQPALRVGLQIDPDLIAQIINDMQGAPGALPLMQFALKDLFDSQKARGGLIALTLADYNARGSIYEALERHADAAFVALTPHERELARSIFKGLIEIGHGNQDTRRTALLSELVPTDADAEEVQEVILKLADARLITTEEEDNTRYTITHEKLITAWPWLEKLINENRETIALQNEIVNDAQEWNDHQRDESYLYSGARLANALEQLDAKRIALSDLSQIFINQSEKVEQAEKTQEEARRQKEVDDARRLADAETKRAEEQARSAANLRKRSLYLAIALVLSLIAGATAAFFGTRSRQQTIIARAGELAAYAVFQREQQFDLSLLLSVEAFRRADTVRTRSVLLDTTMKNPRLGQYLQSHSDAIYSIAFSPDGKVLASGGRDHNIILWNVASGQPIGQPLEGHGDAVTSVAFSPDGKTLASGSFDGTVILWNLGTHLPIGQPLQDHGDAVMSVAFSPDGETLASGSFDGTVILWNVTSGQSIDQPLQSTGIAIESVAFSPDGRTLVSGSADYTITLWNVASHQPIGQPFNGQVGPVTSVAVSRDGKTLAVGGRGGFIILWDLPSQQPIGQPRPAGHSNRVSSVAFSPDGKTLASGNIDGTIILWDISTVLNTSVAGTSAQLMGQPLQDHGNPVTSVAFSPDGKTLASGSFDGTVILWNLVGTQPIGQWLHGHSSFVNTVAFSPDGKTLASGSADYTIILWDIASGQPIGQPIKSRGISIKSVTFSPDGKTLVSQSDENTIMLWDLAYGSGQFTGQPFKGHINGVMSAAFSPDGKILAAASADNTIILWNAVSREPIGQPLRGHPDIVNTVAFSPDGKILASGSADNTIILWDVASHEPIGQPLRGHDEAVTSVAFSPDGKTLASGSDDGTIILWSVAHGSGQAIGKPLRAPSFVGDVAFSPDGKTLASGGWDQNVILWDMTSPQPVGQPLQGHSDIVTSVAFSPDGKILASGSWDQSIILWDLNPQSWIEKTCQRVGRNFTRAEWTQYFPDEDYRATCPQWPLEPESTVVTSPTP